MHVERGERLKVIRLPEELGIKKARWLYGEARNAVEAGPDCAIDFAKVRRIDCSVAQIVLALRRECARKGGNCPLRNTNEITNRLLVYAGVKHDG
jgi:anti-anti-sigma regulatory factor